MPAMETSSALSSTLVLASASASDRLDVHAVALKLPKFWAYNTREGFAQRKLSLLSEILLAGSPSFTTASLLQAMLTQLR